jgi:hypothetical protein
MAGAPVDSGYARRPGDFIQAGYKIGKFISAASKMPVS